MCWAAQCTLQDCQDQRGELLLRVLSVLLGVPFGFTFQPLQNVSRLIDYLITVTQVIVLSFRGEGIKVSWQWYRFQSRPYGTFKGIHV